MGYATGGRIGRTVGGVPRFDLVADSACPMSDGGERHMLRHLNILD